MSDFDLGVLAPNSGDATEKDSLPTRPGSVVDSGVRNMVIDMAYFDKSPGGAMALKLHLKDHEGSFVLKETIWLTSGDAKGNRNTYTDQDGNQQYLPGYLKGTSLAQLVTGKPINEQDVQEKTIKLWNFDQGAELPTKVQCVVSMLNKPLKVGVIKVRENKRAQSGNTWVDTNEPKEKNEVERFFGPDGRTSQETKAGETEAKFINQWNEKYEGELVDRFKPVEGAPTPPVAPAPTPSTGSADDDAPLFS